MNYIDFIVGLNIGLGVGFLLGVLYYRKNLKKAIREIRKESSTKC